MLVSKLNNEYLIGVDYSTRGATTFNITQEEFAKIQSGLAEIVDDEVVDLPAPEPTEPVVTDDGFCEVLVPMSIKDDPSVQAKIEEIKEIYLGNLLGKKETKDGVEYRKLYNIHIDNVSSFLSSEQYIQFSQAGVLFDDKIKNLFKERMKAPTININGDLETKINQILALDGATEETITEDGIEYKKVSFRSSDITSVLNQIEVGAFVSMTPPCIFSSEIVGLFT